jgi:glutathione S-transferase
VAGRPGSYNGAGLPRLYGDITSADCLKVRILLRQLAREYERLPIDASFGGYGLAAPVLELANGLMLAESNAILWYLAESTPYLPATAFWRAEVVQWLVLERDRIRSLASLRDGAAPAEGGRRRVVADALERLDETLWGGPFVVGNAYSIADIALYASVHVAPEAGFDLSHYPSVAEWLARVERQPRFVNDLEPFSAG